MKEKEEEDDQEEDQEEDEVKETKEGAVWKWRWARSLESH